MDKHLGAEVTKCTGTIDLCSGPGNPIIVVSKEPIVLLWEDAMRGTPWNYLERCRVALTAYENGGELPPGCTTKKKNRQPHP